MAHRTNAGSLLALVILAGGAAFADVNAAWGGQDAILPLERTLRERFPSAALDSSFVMEGARETVSGRTLAGFRSLAPGLAAPFAPGRPPGLEVEASSGLSAPPLRVFYPSSYDETFVVEAGTQRVAVRALGARFSTAAPSTGRLFYPAAYDSVDVVHVAAAARTEELLYLRDERAPRVFEYEIVEMRGVRELELVDGAIRFVGDRAGEGANRRSNPSIQIDKPWVLDANGVRSEAAARWTIEKDDAPTARIRLTVDAEGLAFPLLVDPTFSLTGSMLAARGYHSATLLPSGKVLVAGGHSGSGYLDTAELYDPVTGTFTATGPLDSARASHTATLLQNGNVLIAGGWDGTNFLDSAELYDPATGAFTATGSMSGARGYHTATRLQNGKVLLTGGEGAGGSLQTAQLYDPTTGSFASTGDLGAARAFHAAALLQDGKVLVTGGRDGATYTNTAEIYDPAAGAFAATGAMSAARGSHTATVLPDGKVLVAAGSDGTVLNGAELYDPLTGAFTATDSLATPRYVHSATLLPNGKVFLAGGFYDGPRNTAETYDPAAGTFGYGSPLQETRYAHTATLLPSGILLVTGGLSGSYLATTELYDPRNDLPAFSSTSVPTKRLEPAATLLEDGRVLVTGGNNDGTYVKPAEIYDPAANAWTTTGSMGVGRFNHRATLLATGQVLITGGHVGAGNTNTSELYDPTTGTFTPAGEMTAARGAHTATLLRNGKVLVAGSATVSTADLYDPASATFEATGAMNTARWGHSATLLPDGKVLIAGGNASTGETDSAELYDPDTGSFTPTGPLGTPRQGHTATLLPNGKVLIAGGSNGSGSTTTILISAEVYDPVAGTFSPSDDMTWPRRDHAATLRADGRVLIIGGDRGTQTNQQGDLYDPATDTFWNYGSFQVIGHTSILLPNGKVLIAGGEWYGGATAALHDARLDHSEARRPSVSSATPVLCQPGNLSMAGFGFAGDSEASGGGTNSSPSNAPLLRLQRVDSDQVAFASPQTFSHSTFFSTTLDDLPSGHYRASIFANGIPSIERVVEVATTPILGTYPSASVAVAGSTLVAPSFLPPEYDGAFYPVTARASTGFTGTLHANGSTGGIVVRDAGPVGTYAVTVSASTDCGSPTTTFTLDVLGAPDSILANGGTPQSARVDTQFGTPLRALVRDSAGHPLPNVSVAFSAPPSGASATLPAGGASVTDASGVASIVATANGILGSYEVTATVGALTATFALTNTPAIATGVTATATNANSVSVTWTGTTGATYEVLRFAEGGVSSVVGSSAAGSLTDTAVAADRAYLYKVRAILPQPSPWSASDLATTVVVTDPVLVSGATVVKASHVTNLRTAVAAARALAGLGALAWTDAALTPGVTRPRALHVTELRSALDAARTALLLPAIAYARPSISPGMAMSASDIADLRGGVR